MPLWAKLPSLLNWLTDILNQDHPQFSRILDLSLIPTVIISTNKVRLKQGWGGGVDLGLPMIQVESKVYSLSCPLYLFSYKYRCCMLILIAARVAMLNLRVKGPNSPDPEGQHKTLTASNPDSSLLRTATFSTTFMFPFTILPQLFDVCKH